MDGWMDKTSAKSFKGMVSARKFLGQDSSSRHFVSWFPGNPIKNDRTFYLGKINSGTTSKADVLINDVLTAVKANKNLTHTKAVGHVTLPFFFSQMKLADEIYGVGAEAYARIHMSL